MRKKASTMCFSLSLILLLAILPDKVTFAQKVSESEAKILKIGGLAAITGFGSSAEKLLWEGYQVAEEWLNDRGGITVDGQKYTIKVVTEDNKGSADGTVAAANKLVYEENVKFVVGDVMHWTIAAAGTITERSGVLRAIQYNVCTPAEYGPNTPYTFLMDAGTLEYGRGLLNYIKRTYPEKKTAVLIYPDEGAVRYLAPRVKEIAEERNFEILGDEITWPQDTVDFNPVIKKALARQPDILYMVNGWPAATGSMVKSAREAGFNGLIISNISAEDIAKVAGPAASTNIVGIGVLSDSPDMTPLIKELAPRFKEKFGYALFYHYMGFNSVYMLVQAIESAQSLEPDDVKKSIEKMDTMESVYGTARLGGLKTYGINHTVYHPIGIQELMNNEVKHVSWEDITVP